MHETRNSAWAQLLFAITNAEVGAGCRHRQMHASPESKGVRYEGKTKLEWLKAKGRQMGEPGKAESKLESDLQHRCEEPCGDLL